jgi:hypothetical protein
MLYMLHYDSYHCLGPSFFYSRNSSKERQSCWSWIKMHTLPKKDTPLKTQINHTLKTDMATLPSSVTS